MLFLCFQNRWGKNITISSSVLRFEKHRGRNIAISRLDEPRPSRGNLGASPRSWPISAATIAVPCTAAPMEALGDRWLASTGWDRSVRLFELGPKYYAGVESMSVED